MGSAVYWNNASVRQPYYIAGAGPPPRDLKILINV